MLDIFSHFFSRITWTCACLPTYSYHTLQRKALKIPQMRQYVGDQPRSVPLEVRRALVCLNVRRLDGLVVGLVDVVLRTDVRKVQDDRRDVWHRVVPVRNTVVSTCLRGDVVCELGAGYARCAKGVERHCVPVVPQVCGCERGYRPTEGVACCFDLVRWVCRRKCLDGCHDGCASVEPGLPKAAVGCTA